MQGEQEKFRERLNVLLKSKRSAYLLQGNHFTRRITDLEEEVGRTNKLENDRADAERKAEDIVRPIMPNNIPSVLDEWYGNASIDGYNRNDCLVKCVCRS